MRELIEVKDKTYESVSIVGLKVLNEGIDILILLFLLEIDLLLGSDRGGMLRLLLVELATLNVG